jgi:hypothetical protein
MEEKRLISAFVGNRRRSFGVWLAMPMHVAYRTCIVFDDSTEGCEQVGIIRGHRASSLQVVKGCLGAAIFESHFLAPHTLGCTLNTEQPRTNTER